MGRRRDAENERTVLGPPAGQAPRHEVGANGTFREQTGRRLTESLPEHPMNRRPPLRGERRMDTDVHSWCDAYDEATRYPDAVGDLVSYALRPRLRSAVGASSSAADGP